MSFISKENDNQWQIKSINPKTGKIKVIANTIKDVEDICWLDDKILLSGKDNTLYKLRLNRDNDWKTVADLLPSGITKITRLSANNSASKLLIAGDIGIAETEEIIDKTIDDVTDETNETVETPTLIDEDLAAQLVQKHIEPFNKRQLETFAKAFNVDVIVNRFPNTKMYSGRNVLKENYRQFFKNNKKSNVTVLNRMTHNNFVIDEELVALNNTTNRQITIYETDSKSITSMTFIGNSHTTSNPEAIVNKQLEVYNNRNIDEFSKTYTKDVQLYMYPKTLNTNGQSALYKQYNAMFKRVPDLNAEIINRIVLGNKVIDKEKVLKNGEIIYAIAIYEVENNLISKVTFIQ